MADTGDLADKTTLEQWAVDLLKSELKLSNYMLSPMCQRTQYTAGRGNWDLSGIKRVVRQFSNTINIIHARMLYYRVEVNH